MVTRYTASNETIRQDYFDWLCGLVGDRCSWMLLRTLHDRDFVPVIKRDENRALDGIELREEYYETNPYFETDALEGPCSVLEMLIALAQRIDFETKDAVSDEIHTSDWFWEMLDNLGISCYDDDNFYDLDAVFNIAEALDVFLSRSYGADGLGGIFPLKWPTADQREIEIWFQKEAYLKERIG